MSRMAFACGLFGLVLMSPGVRGEDDPPPDKPKPRPDLKFNLSAQSGFTGAKGSVRYRDRPDVRELDVEVEKTGLPRGTVLTVMVNGNVIGTAKIGFLGGGKLELRSKKNDVIPFVTIGSYVLVRTDVKAVVAGRL